MDLHAIEVDQRINALQATDRPGRRKTAMTHLIRLSHDRHTSDEQIMRMVEAVIGDIEKQSNRPRAAMSELASLETIAFSEQAMQATKGASGVRVVDFMLPYLTGDAFSRMHAANALAGMAWDKNLRALTDMKSSGRIVSSLIRAAVHEQEQKQITQKGGKVRHENFLQNATTIVSVAAHSDDLARLDLQPAFNELIDMIFPPYGGSSGIRGTVNCWAADSKATLALVNAMADTKIDFGLSLRRSEELGEWYDTYDGLDWMLRDGEYKLKEALVRLKPPAQCHPF